MIWKDLSGSNYDLKAPTFKSGSGVHVLRLSQNRAGAKLFQGSVKELAIITSNLNTLEMEDIRSSLSCEWKI